MPAHLIDLTGRTFGRLTVTQRAGSNKWHQATWECLCDCGKTAVVSGYNLTRGLTMSCGCLVGLVRRTRPGSLYDGLTIAEHVARSGIPRTTLQKRIDKWGHPFRPHLEKTPAEQELRVFEQDRENNRRSFSRRIGAAAAWHKTGNTLGAPEPVNANAARTGDEERAAFGDHEAANAAAHREATPITPNGPMRERWGINGVPFVRPSRRDRGLK
jgi:hypothetical protein